MDWLLSHIDVELFHLGATPVTPLAILVFLLTLVASLILGRALRTLIMRVVAARSKHHNEGLAYAVGRIGQYLVVISGILLGLDNLGISLAALTALGAMLSVGIGFGLQNIAQNFISGVILLLERPIQHGDVIEVDGVLGRVTEIEMRATRLLTLDGISVLVPNSKLISEDVRNMHAPERTNRVRVAVGVAYGSDTELVRKTLLEVGKAHREVLAKPAPTVFFTSFGDSSLDFELAVWLDNAERRPIVSSELRFAIDAAFREHDIQIPFPQRDLHIKSGLPQAAEEGP
ncbi:MAG: mechanosensitive ion channel family protein [Sandaracinaceae bacterium]